MSQPDRTKFCVLCASGSHRPEDHSTPCDWCRKPGATHTADEHPLPQDHADYDAFFDASDAELAGMASEAMRNVRSWRRD